MGLADKGGYRVVMAANGHLSLPDPNLQSSLGFPFLSGLSLFLPDPIPLLSPSPFGFRPRFQTVIHHVASLLAVHAEDTGAAKVSVL